MKLYKFHVLDTAFCSVKHGNSIAGCNGRIRGTGINLSCTSGTHDSTFGNNCFNIIGVKIEDIGPIAIDLRRQSCDILTQVMLRNDIDGVVVAANYNCPGQLVISGEVSAVEKACATTLQK